MISGASCAIVNVQQPYHIDAIAILVVFMGRIAKVTSLNLTTCEIYR